MQPGVLQWLFLQHAGCVQLTHSNGRRSGVADTCLKFAASQAAWGAWPASLETSLPHLAARQHALPVPVLPVSDTVRMPSCPPKDHLTLHCVAVRPF